MNEIPLYPLRFEPVYQYRLWGGQRLAGLLDANLPGDEPIGEAWLLSDRDEHSSVIANGPLKGRTLRDMINERPVQTLGALGGLVDRFPLLLKFLDVRGSLSVQVHPSDQQTAFLPAGETGKTEAWVVLAAGPGSRVYAGLMPDTSRPILRQALAKGTVADRLASFTPKAGDAVYISAGTVHSLHDLVVFEVQENSDVTFRLYDWKHIDSKTHALRPLQVEQAMACIDFSRGAVIPVVPVVEAAEPALRERLIDCEHFGLWRIRSELPFAVGMAGRPRVLVCIEGEGYVTHDGAGHSFGKGDVLLLPAEVGACACLPQGFVTLLEIAAPEGG